MQYPEAHALKTALWEWIEEEKDDLATLDTRDVGFALRAAAKVEAIAAVEKFVRKLGIITKKELKNITKKTYE